ncbi:MAG: ATP-binding cassette domain-containing protein [Planctomycetaceae bacterium]
MSLLSLRDVHFTWGGPPLLDGIDLEIEPGERVGLLGRNGEGKSTLMKLMAGEVAPDDGKVRLAAGVRVARLVQDVPPGDSGTIAELVERGAHELNSGGNADSGTLAEEWKVSQAVERAVSRLNLDGAARFAELSSGMKRRALLARALVCEPDILLLDEPTNHLDIESIAWLEGFLQAYRGTLVFVTHDRMFLQSLATRINEVDRARLFDWSCDYETFLNRKQQVLDAEDKQNAAFDRKLAEEEVWIRRGIKARRTRNEGRVRALKDMREERRRRRSRVGNVRMQAQEAERSGRLVIETKDLAFSYGDQPIVRNLSLLLSRGDKVGIIGPNGAGKTTLLKLLLGELKPTSGTIRHGMRLEVIYFDQLRDTINEEQTVVENVGEGQELLEINGKRQHIYGYLQDFLFTPERARRPARYLSGGERNRLMLARLFKRPSNVMVLDEPTNDLDAETLELLEELVANYTGTLLIVSHDRTFLNNVVTSTLAFEGNGVIKEYDGGYDDYVRQCASSPSRGSESPPAGKQNATNAASNSTAGPVRLSYRERQELESLPAQIDSLEQEQSKLHAAMAEPTFFKQDGTAIAASTARLEEVGTRLAELLSRWEELEDRAL